MQIPETNALCDGTPELVQMGQYIRGDVLLASVALDNQTCPKTRPVVVIDTSSDGNIYSCPVSSKPPNDAQYLPLTIDDFATGGLDLFSESYIMTSRVTTIHCSKIIGKKGRLTKDSLAEILIRIPATSSLTKIPNLYKKRNGHIDTRK